MLAANLITPGIIDQYGWEQCFYVFAALPLLWLPLWQSFLASSKKEYNCDNSEKEKKEKEKEKAIDGGEEEERGKVDYVVPVSVLLSLPSVRAIAMAQYCQSWGMYGLLSWLPSYYTQQFGIPLQVSLSLIPSLSLVQI